MKHKVALSATWVALITLGVSANGLAAVDQSPAGALTIDTSPDGRRWRVARGQAEVPDAELMELVGRVATAATIRREQREQARPWQLAAYGLFGIAGVAALRDAPGVALAGLGAGLLSWTWGEVTAARYGKDPHHAIPYEEAKRAVELYNLGLWHSGSKRANP